MRLAEINVILMKTVRMTLAVLSLHSCVVAHCRDQGVYDYKTVRRWTMEKRLKMWGQVSVC